MPAVSMDRFTTELLDLYAPPLRAKRTQKKMRMVLRRMAGTPGVSRTSDLTPDAVARFCSGAPETCGPNSLRGQLGYLSAACAYAVHRGYLRASPFAFRPPGQWVRPARRRAARHHGQAEIARVLESLRVLSGSWEGGRLFALASLVAYTGLRRDEALHLHAADVHLDEGYLDVEPRPRLKTLASAAPVPLPDRLVVVLREWLPRCGAKWAFPNLTRRGPWTGGSYGARPIDRLKDAGRAVGVEGFTFLSLRHSFATHAEAWGLSPLLLQRVLRHATVSTQEHYRHADVRNLRAGVARIEYRDGRAGAA